MFFLFFFFFFCCCCSDKKKTPMGRKQFLHEIELCDSLLLFLFFILFSSLLNGHFVNVIIIKYIQSQLNTDTNHFVVKLNWTQCDFAPSRKAKVYAQGANHFLFRKRIRIGISIVLIHTEKKTTSAMCIY